MAQWRPLLDYPLWIWGVGVALGVIALGAAAMRRIGFAAAAGVLCASLLGWHARAVFLPSQTWVQPTVVARAALAEICALPDEGEGCEAPGMVQAVGYAEPSYVMTTGTQNLHPPETVVALPGSDAGYPAAFLINLEDEDGPVALAALSAEAEAAGACETRSSPHYGLNYSNGDPVHFVAVRFDLGACE